MRHNKHEYSECAFHTDAYTQARAALRKTVRMASLSYIYRETLATIRPFFVLFSIPM